MKKYIVVIFGMLFLHMNPTIAETYHLYNSSLYNSGTSNGQKGNKGSKCPVRPICVDITDNILSVPSQFIGYTLSLTNLEGEQYIFINQESITLSNNLKGEFDIQITNGNQSYEGSINIK